MINFGEPAEPTLQSVTPFLERIFLQNADLERDEAALARARKLAADRAPGLLADYLTIGGSPLNAQAEAQSDALQEAIENQGVDARAYAVFQFTPPSIRAGVERAHDDGVDLLVGLPVYPMCGHSTTVAALDTVQTALDQLGWGAPFVGIAGWHHYPDYLSMRVDHIGEFVRSEGLDLDDPETILYFSAHGTPVKYLTEGSRYDRYVEQHCKDIANGLGGVRFAVGFQNHTNRRIQWTQPDNEDRIATLSEKRLVLDAVSFMHEQSETLAELDRDLRALLASQDKEMYRVPVPHDDARFIAVLADLVGEAVRQYQGEHTGLAACRCRPAGDTWCTNGARELGPSPYAPAQPSSTISEKPAAG